MEYFAGMGLSNFLDDSRSLSYSKEFMGEEMTDDLIAKVEPTSAPT